MDYSKIHGIKNTIRDIQKTLECPICLELLTNPYQTQCQHQFCKECIYTVLLSNSKPQCPLCKEPINKRGLQQNTQLDEIVHVVQELHGAVLKDSGVTGIEIFTPPRIVCQTMEAAASGTPGIKLHSLQHPTPLKPHRHNTKNC